MKYRIKYSPDAGDKLRELNKQISANYGKPVAAKIVSKIMGEVPLPTRALGSPR